MPYMEHMEDGAAETNWMLDGELKAVIGLKRNGNMYQYFTMVPQTNYEALSQLSISSKWRQQTIIQSTAGKDFENH